MVKRIGVLIGRFQGYHQYHHEHVSAAALENDLLIILIGSANVRRSIKNPFTVEERIQMIEANIKDDMELRNTRIVFRPANNHPDNAVWASWVKQHVNQFVGELEPLITLYGSDKDASTFYLSLFPEWKKAVTPAKGTFNATRMREQWFEAGQLITRDMGKNMEIPTPTLLWLANNWKYNENLQGEWQYYKREKALFSGYPFPETLTFNCADAVVRCHDRVLMIRRKHNPGKGCLALPGGFKNRDETFFDAAVRELKEETTIDIPYTPLMLSLVKTQLFDDPSRSMGIPRATLAAYFDVSKYYLDGEYPNTKADDDADEVEWVRINDLMFATDVYDDHSAIVTTLTQGT
jgi:bifunctional NMN adenylyltransferase/nudix hydrolase